MLDAVVWLFGTPSSITAQSASSVRSFQNYGGDDIADIVMRFQQRSIIGHIHLSRVAHKKEETLVVTGTNGTLSLDAEEPCQYRMAPTGSEYLDYSTT